MTDFNQVRTRGYRLHEELADLLDKDRYAHGYSCSIPVVLDDGRVVTLRRTSNAGFRGIEGHFVTADDEPFTTDLGHVASLEPTAEQLRWT